MSATLVADIETVAAPGGEERVKAVMSMFEGGADDWFDSPASFAALSPALARIVAVGFVSVETQRARVVYDSELCGTTDQEIAVACQGEKALLTAANAVLAKGTKLVTFRGRNFDVPTLVHGMIANGIVPAPLLMAAWREPRYHPRAHMDLWEQFTAFGASHGHGGATLRAWALRYGLPDPKAFGDGSDVPRLVEEKRADELVNYCIGDVWVTAGLYKAWRLMVEAPVGELARS